MNVTFKWAHEGVMGLNFIKEWTHRVNGIFSLKNVAHLFNLQNQAFLNKENKRDNKGKNCLC